MEESIKESVDQGVSISWDNKPGLRDASLGQKTVRLLGDGYTLAVSNMLTLHGVRFTCSFGSQSRGGSAVTSTQPGPQLMLQSVRVGLTGAPLLRRRWKL